MRIRQIKPSFWSDPLIAQLAEPTRLMYIGLWQIADDAGWLRWDVAEVGHELYGYESRSRRERRVAAMFAELVTAGRIVQHPCGHVEVPTLVEHQKLAGSTRQVRTIFNDHLKLCVSAAPRVSPPIPADPRESPPLVKVKERSGMGQVRNGTERNGSAGASAIDDEEPTEFQRLVPVAVALGSKS